MRGDDVPTILESMYGIPRENWNAQQGSIWQVTIFAVRVK
jgi:hypothetical protein